MNGKPDISNIEDIDLERLMNQVRKQTMIFKAAQEVWQEMNKHWPASEYVLIAELVRLAEQFIDSDGIQISPDLFNQDEKRKQIVMALNMTKIIRHFSQAIEFQNTERTTLVFDSNHPIRSPLICVRGEPVSPRRNEATSITVFMTAVGSIRVV